MNTTQSLLSTFSQILPMDTVTSLTNDALPEEQKKIYERLLVFILSTLIKTISDTLESPLQRREFMDKLLFNALNPTFFEELFREHHDLLPIIRERIERALIGILAEG